MAVKFNQKELDRMMEEAVNWQPQMQTQTPDPQSVLQKLRGRQPASQVNVNAQN